MPFTDRINSERGFGMLIFFSVALPILLAMVMLGVDFGVIFLERSEDKATLDNAALVGAKYLPYSAAAAAAARSYAEQWGGYNSADLEVTASNSEIYLALRKKAETSLLHPANNKQISVTTEAKATMVPRDALLFVDLSDYMAPKGGVAPEMWGIRVKDGSYVGFAASTDRSEIEHQWLESPWLSQLSPYSGMSLEHRVQHTQQCFNPVFSAFKQAMIRFYDYLSSFPLNSVGVIAGPTGTGAAGVVKLKQVGRAGFANGAAEAEFIDTKYAQVWNRECLGIAEEDYDAFIQHYLSSGENFVDPTDNSIHGPYFFPRYSTDLNVGAVYGNVLQPSPPQDDLVDTAGNINVAQTQDRLTARQAIWSLAAHHQRRIGFRTLMQRVGEELIDYAEVRDVERGALAPLTTRSAFVFLGDMPATYQGGNLIEFGSPSDHGEVSDAIRDGLTDLDQVAKAAQKKILLYLGVVRVHNQYQTQGLCAVSQECPAFLTLASQLENTIQGIVQAHNWKWLEVKYLVVTDPTSLAHDLASYLPLTDNQPVLKNL